MYALFTVNEEVSPDREMGLTAQYRQRWEIENEYKTIKKHFLPTSSAVSKTSNSVGVRRQYGEL